MQDWPPTAKLAESHPKLYQDFSLALPIPEYTRRDGFYNLAAHFPVNSGVPPDLGMSQYLFVHSCGDKSMEGPKVYMALASKQVDGYSGSTRLHCDLCDAVNLMVYSSPPEGTAIWHIFKVCDVNKIRVYIRDAFNHLQQDDPIHSQWYYLGPTNLEELKTMHGVVPFAIHQGVGEAVFIPAGCPHQV